MTSGQTIGYILNNAAGVTAICSTRIYQGLIPESVTTLPAISYIFISAPNLDGNAERERWQISCYASTAEAAKELAFQVRYAFNNIQATYNSFDVQMGYYDNSVMTVESPGIYNVPVDIFLFYIRT